MSDGDLDENFDQLDDDQGPDQDWGADDWQTFSQPAAVEPQPLKFRNFNAENPPRGVQTPQKRKTRAGSKAVKSAKENEVQESEEEVEKETKTKKKRKKKAVVQSDDETEEPVRVVEITAYIMVERPLPPQQRGRPAKVSENEKYLQRPPFKFLSSDNYATFIVKISQALPCSALNIIEDAISWKPQTPKSSALLLLGGETGYSSMVDHFVGKKQGRVVMLMMPPPRKPVEKLFWDEGNEAPNPAKEFDYAGIEVQSTTDHLVEQRVTFDKKVGPIKEQLEAAYPLDNNPRFPGKRVFTNATGIHWDIDSVRMNVWASHMARGTATLTNPPVSTHFDYAHRLRAPPEQTVPAMDSGALPAALAPTLVSAPVLTPAPAPAPASTTSSLVEVMLLSMIQQQHAHFAAQSAAPMAPVHSSTASLTTDIGSKMPSAHLRVPDVSLDQFCTHYHISATDRARLEKMEFRPGDMIDTLGPEEWKDFGGFLVLSWSRIKVKNQEFLDDVRKGLWGEQ
ncbi:hypothetical protein BJ912DRAFT_1004170 [Pholiota molesta]|nr:hypothetical protein BJ912DRAFT_1004170 [Pholiota molesta]